MGKAFMCRHDYCCTNKIWGMLIENKNYLYICMYVDPFNSKYSYNQALCFSNPHLRIWID